MTTLTDWLGTFLNILIKPSAKTFQEEAEKAEGKTFSAYMWLVFLILILNIIAHFTYRGGVTEYTQWYFAIIISLVIPIGFLFFIFVLHTLYKKLFNRKKELHGEILYIMTAIVFIGMIFNIIASLLSTTIPSPFNQILNYLTYAYIVFMMIFAFKSLTNMKVWQSIVTVFLSIILGGVGFICVPVFILLVTSTTPDFLGF